MKRSIAAICISLLSFALFAQDEVPYNEQANPNELRTLMSPGTDHGGYGAIHFGYGLIDDKGAIMTGLRAGWVVNHSFTLGLAFNGFFNDLDDNPAENVVLAGGYGGLLIEPIIFPRSPVHLSIPIIAGVGGVASLEEIAGFEGDPWGDYNYLESDVFFVIEPGVNLELSVAQFMRLGLGISYRLTDNFKINGIDDQALQSFSTSLILKFGKF